MFGLLGNIRLIVFSPWFLTPQISWLSQNAQPSSSTHKSHNTLMISVLRGSLWHRQNEVWALRYNTHTRHGHGEKSGHRKEWELRTLSRVESIIPHCGTCDALAPDVYRRLVQPYSLWSSWLQLFRLAPWTTFVCSIPKQYCICTF